MNPITHLKIGAPGSEGIRKRKVSGHCAKRLPQSISFNLKSNSTRRVSFFSLLFEDEKRSLRSLIEKCSHTATRYESKFKAFWPFRAKGGALGHIVHLIPAE